jgi:hypothetical protein
MVTPIYQFTLTPIYSLASYTRKEEKMVSDPNLLPFQRDNQLPVRPRAEPLLGVNWGQTPFMTAMMTNVAQGINAISAMSGGTHVR